MQKKAIKVLYEDNHLIAVFKPHRVPTQGDDSHDPSLLELVKKDLKERYKKPGNVFLGLVHRLDRPTAGVIVFAKTSKAASRLSESFRERETKKTYHALVEGNVIGNGELTHYLLEEEGQPVKAFEKDSNGRKKASLFYRVLKQCKDCTQVEIDLLTGRKHQIRAQFSALGHPILGDKKYGSTREYKKGSIALIAKRLSLPHPTKDELITIETEEGFQDV